MLLGCLVIAGTAYELYLSHKAQPLEEHACMIDDAEIKEQSSGERISQNYNLIT